MTTVGLSSVASIVDEEVEESRGESTIIPLLSPSDEPLTPPNTMNPLDDDEQGRTPITVGGNASRLSTEVRSRRMLQGSRKGTLANDAATAPQRVRKRGRKKKNVMKEGDDSEKNEEVQRRGACSYYINFMKSTIGCMTILARVVVWSSVIALAAGVVWYSYELTRHGTNPHLIAWFSAGAFVLLGFPLSMGSIVVHLANYNQPHVQCYIVRILWMVPIYSMESWLCLRFHEYAIYIETMRDLYESFVLYSFLQFLIQVLGGEEALVLMLKDKSPTRGVHMWGLQWCIKPWLMGQPVRKADEKGTALEKVPVSPTGRRPRTLKRVQWTSPFFVKCKFGVLQYVLLKFLCTIAIAICEFNGVYHEGDFTYKGGYLYICIITNASQCWALYCLIFFYYATKNELGPIRPVGKFLSVKALVFFTWWQSVVISIIYQMDMMPRYQKESENWSSEDVAKGIQDYLICVEMFFAAVVHTFVFPHSEYSPQAVRARARALNQSATNPGFRQRLGRFQNQRAKSYGFLLANYSYNKDDKSAYSGSMKSAMDSTNGYFDLEMTTLGAPAKSWDIGSESDSLPTDSRQRLESVDSVESDRAWMVNPSDTPDYGEDSHRDDWEVDQGLNSLSPNTALVADNSGLQQHIKPQLSVQDEHEEEGTDCEYDEEDVEMDGEYSTDGESGEEDEDMDEEEDVKKPNFVRAFWDSAIPRDLRDNTVGIVNGDYIVERKTLLHHAATSDHYDLFSQSRRFKNKGGSSANSSRDS